MKRRHISPGALLLTLLVVMMTGACSNSGEDSPAADLDQAVAATTATEPPITTPEAAEPPDGPMIDMARLDSPAVQGYANAHGVSPEQAAEIISWQVRINEQLGRVSSAAGSRYAGARFVPPEENDGEAVVEIYIASPTEEDFAAVAQLDRAILVEAIAGMDELNRIAADAETAAAKQNPGASISVTVDPATGEVDVAVEYPVVDG